MDYFDPAYFDGSYFDIADGGVTPEPPPTPSAGGGTGKRSGFNRRLPVVVPPVTKTDEAETHFTLFL